MSLSAPPTPTPTTAMNDAKVIKLGEPPAARPKTPARNRVILKHHLASPKVIFAENIENRVAAPSSQDIATKTPEYRTNE